MVRIVAVIVNAENERRILMGDFEKEEEVEEELLVVDEDEELEGSGEVELEL